MAGGGFVSAGTHEHSVSHQSGCSRSAFGSLVNGYWLYSQAYREVRVMLRRWPPFTVTSSGAVMPPPPGASGMLYRTVIAFAAAGSVNSTCWRGASRTAVRPDASAGSVYAVRSGPMTVPVVAACSASCSRKATSAPRPATRAGSSPARVTTGARESAAAVPSATPSPSPVAATTATVSHRDRLWERPVRAIADPFLSDW